LLKAGQTTLDYRKLKRKDGSFIEMEIGTKMLPDGNLIATGRDITERRKNEKLLREEKDKFTKIAATAPGLIYSFMRTEKGSFKFPYTSDAIESILGFSHEELQRDAKKVFARVHKDDLVTVLAHIETSANTMTPCRNEFRYQHPVKGEIWLEGHSIPTKDIAGSIIWYGVLTDATYRKESEKKIIKTSRLYSFISHIDQIIVRSTKEKSLFRDVCDIAVTYGKFRLAWVGLTNEQTKTITPVAHSSNEKNIFQLFKNISYDNFPDGQGPTGTAVREERYVVCNDIRNDTGLAFSMENIIKQGLRSLISFPIRKFGNVIGVFAVYAGEVNFFDDNEIHLLQEAVNDVSFALENFEKERLRIEAEEHLAASEKRFKKLVEHGNDAILILNAEGQSFYISSSVQKVLGYTEDELRSLDILALSHPESSETIKNVIKTAVENPGKTFRAPTVKILHKDGTYHWYESTITNLIDDPDIGGIVDNFRDVTEKVLSEQILKESEENYRTLVEQASDAIFISDENGKFLTVNSSGVKLSQYSEEELMQMSIYDFFVEEDVKKNPIQFEALKAGKTVRSERLMRRKDGLINHVEITAKIMTNGKLLSFVRDIAERKKAEETIKIANERFNLLASVTADMIWDWNLETDEVWWNKTYYNVFGNSDLSYDIIGWKNIVHPDDRRRVIDGIYKAIHAGEKRWEDEYRCIDPGGNILFIYDRGFVLYNANGKPYRMIGSMVNLTEQKKAEAEIKISEEKYRTLVEQASDAILIADDCGNIVTVNNSACRLLGYNEIELLRMKISDFTTEEDKKRSVLRFDQLNQGKTLVTEGLIKIKGDLKLNVEFTAKLLSDGRLLFFIKDISERIRAQNEIINEKELSDSLINNLPGIFYLYDEEGRFLRWNKNFEAVTGYDGDEIKNMHPKDFYDASLHEFVAKRIESVFREKSPGVEALLLTKSKKKIPFYFNSMSINYKSKPCLIGMGMDISSQKKAEEEIRRLASHLQDIREEERKRIGREIHDELGQQLTAIKMDVSWLNKKLPEEPSLIKTKLKNVINLLDSSNLSIRRILNELRPSILEKHGFIESMEWLGVQFTKNTGIPVIFKSPETELTLPEVIITGLFRIYQEALNNITKYAQATEVASTLNVEEDLLVFTVEDNGQGFDPNNIVSKKSFGILGMKERIILLGGEFELTSAPGNGTKIYIFLPLNN
jgi:PAS domain S-box-containing protein